MEKEFISYNEALALKELGFDEQCLGHYVDSTEMFSHKRILGKLNLGFLGQCKSEPYDWNHTPNWGIKFTIYTSAPLYQQVFRWFREKYKLEGYTYHNANGYEWTIGEYNENSFLIKQFEDKDEVTHKLYEEAELACLQSLIKLAQDEKTK